MILIANYFAFKRRKGLSNTPLL